MVYLSGVSLVLTQVVLEKRPLSGCSSSSSSSSYIPWTAVIQCMDGRTHLLHNLLLQS